MRKCNTSSSRSREKIGAMRRAMGGTRDETEEEEEEDEQRGIRMKRAEDQSRQFRCDVELLGRLVVTVIAASKHGRHSNRRASVVLPVSCCNVLQVALRGCCTKQDNDFVYLMGHKWR